MDGELQDNFVERFDSILSEYMRSIKGWGGDRWRKSCHQSAKIAAAALADLLPEADVRARRVELIAHMAGTNRCAHIGWKLDTSSIGGQYPMHWAVSMSGDLYDPTFWQLRLMKTPLTLPDQPFCYAPGMIGRLTEPGAKLDDGFLWVGHAGAPGLRIGYCLRDDPLPDSVARTLMSNAEAAEHGLRVAEMVRERTQ